jgi:2,3-bisphosphoglycerate-dependent phosphoglycerate mutase
MQKGSLVLQMLAVTDASVYCISGDLVGKNKKEVVLQFGKDQVKRWRRSYDEPPPEMQDDHPFHPARDPRYHAVSNAEPHG